MKESAFLTFVKIYDMLYKVIGLMSGSSLDGLDIAYVHIEETGGKWRYEIIHTACMPYEEAFRQALRDAVDMRAIDYQLLHVSFGQYIGKQLLSFIDQHALAHKVDLIASHGHTTFHLPSSNMTGQIGDGAAIAAITELPVITDLRAVDVALGGQGAPIVPIGEKWLLPAHRYFLNLGGIANVSANFDDNRYVAFDICAANRVLNMIIEPMGLPYDAGGQVAATGRVDADLLAVLNGLDFYQMPYPKSLANDFGTHVVFPLIDERGLSIPDALATYVEHIAIQIAASLVPLQRQAGDSPASLLASGGGAFNQFLLERLQENLRPLHITIAAADPVLIEFKEALVMALMGVLRYREENNVMSSVTGASRDSVGGALWKTV
jgi:anhydro-N-acetylmuramic acid kinase